MFWRWLHHGDVVSGQVDLHMTILQGLVGLVTKFEDLIFVQRQVFLQKRKRDLENAKEIIAEYERRMSAKVKKQEQLDIVEERDFIRG